MKKIKILLFIVSLSVLQLSCGTDAIDFEPQGAISSEVVFTDPAFAETYLNAVYDRVPNGWFAPGNWYMLTSATDDAENSYTWPNSNTIFKRVPFTQKSQCIQYIGEKNGI